LRAKSAENVYQDPAVEVLGQYHRTSPRAIRLRGGRNEHDVLYGLRQAARERGHENAHRGGSELCASTAGTITADVSAAGRFRERLLRVAQALALVAGAA
jgi:hypothetical protein